MRCAAVFALGTFVGNSAERTDHSTTIDHNVAMMLAQLINDGSPVVRKVGCTHTHTHVFSLTSLSPMFLLRSLTDFYCGMMDCGMSSAVGDLVFDRVGVGFWLTVWWRWVLQELVVALSHLVVQYESNFCTVALQFMEEEKNYPVPSPANTLGTHTHFKPLS